MKGFGPVVTGTLISGSVHPEDELELFPAGRRVRVRGLHSSGASVAEAVAGQRTAINLAGVRHEDLTRGMTLASPGIFQPTNRLNARVDLLSSAPPLKNRSPVHFHCGSAETTAEVILLEGAVLQPGHSTLAQLRLAEPTLLLRGDRFILRRFSPVTTVGGGLVIDPFAPYHRSRNSSTLPLIKILEGNDREAIAENLADQESKGLTVTRLVARTGWSKKQANEILHKLLDEKKIVQLEAEPLRVAHAAKVAECARRILDELEKFHRADPLAQGLAKEALRGRIRLYPKVFTLALAQLIEVGAVAVSGDLVRSSTHQVATTSTDARAMSAIEQAFHSASLAAPDPAEVFKNLSLDPKLARRLFQLLVAEKKIVKVTESLYFHTDALTKLRQSLAQYRQSKGPRLSVGEFKALTGVTRKYAVPLLEYLDRQGLTRRQGDERVIL
jgi:selenocysteine-specific elongation factor